MRAFPRRATTRPPIGGESPHPTHVVDGRGQVFDMVYSPARAALAATRDARREGVESERMKPLTIAYAAFALAGLASALIFGIPYWSAPGASLADFGRLAYANDPAATLSADVTVLYFLANLWIVVEGRRRAMRRLWVYLAANTFVAVAFGLPLFLLVRELGLGAPAREGEPARVGG